MSSVSSGELKSKLDEIARAFRGGVDLQDRRFRLKTFKNCFIGSEAVDFMIAIEMAHSRDDAVKLGKALASEFFLFEHVTRDHEFMDDYKFYHFIPEKERGCQSLNEKTGQTVSWGDFLDATKMNGSNGKDRNPQMPSIESTAYDSIDSRDLHVAKHVWPLDDHNQRLLNNVHPPDWNDPFPKDGDSYDLVVIGGGPAGLVTAAGAAGVGAKVALIECHLLGGDCLNVGCVPSKALIHSANLAHTLRGDMERLNNSGIFIKGGAENVGVDFEKVMERIRKLRADISHHDSAERFSKELGVHVYIGRGRFSGERTIEVNEQTLNFKKAVIATGGYPGLIKMKGLKELHDMATAIDNPEQQRPAVVTNETLFNLTSQPKHLVVIGAGVIGIEMAQAMRRLGSDVTVLGGHGRILSKEDEDMAELVQAQMIKDGVKFNLGVVDYLGIVLTGNVGSNGLPEMKMKVCEKRVNDAYLEMTCDAVLVAAGRLPNVTGMNLEVAGVKYSTITGLEVNDKLQTSNPRIFGVGDVASQYKFTHAADFMARTVIKNALFFGSEKLSSLLIPYATFTSPEIASVGLYERDLKKNGVEYRIFEKSFRDNDRAITDDERVGFVRFRVDAKTDKILGASIVGKDAGNMISEITLAMQSETGLGSLAAVIHPYPTTAEVVRQAGDVYNKTRLTNTVKQLLRGIIKLQR